MVKKPSILIVNRVSVVAGAPLSRSVEERLFEPIQRLHALDQLDFEIISELKWQEADLQSFTHILLNRAHSEYAVQLVEQAKKLNIKVISDLDDLPIYFPKGDKAYLDSKKQHAFAEVLSHSDAIVCSTEKIREWATTNHQSTFSQTINTGFDFERIDRKTKAPVDFFPNTVVLTNAGSLKLGRFGNEWLECMENGLSKHNWRLAVFADSVSYFPERFPLTYFGSVPWFDHKVAVNKAFPIAVVPLASYEDPAHLLYSQYKTPVKYIIYGGLGVPCIYSKSPIYENEVQDGVTGMLVQNTVEDWANAIQQLIEDPEKGRVMAENAAADVRARYDIANVGQKWLDLLKSV